MKAKLLVPLGAYSKHCINQDMYNILTGAVLLCVKFLVFYHF